MYLAGVRLSRILACLVFHLFRRWNYINIRFIWLPILYKIWNNIALKIYIWCVSQIHNNLFCQFSLSSILLPIHNKTQSIEPRKKKKKLKVLNWNVEPKVWTLGSMVGHQILFIIEYWNADVAWLVIKFLYGTFRSIFKKILLSTTAM